MNPGNQGRKLEEEFEKRFKAATHKAKNRVIVGAHVEKCFDKDGKPNGIKVVKTKNKNSTQLDILILKTAVKDPSKCFKPTNIKTSLDIKLSVRAARKLLNEKHLKQDYATNQATRQIDKAVDSKKIRAFCPKN